MLEVLFQVGPVTFRSFDLLVALGFVLSLFFLIKYAVRKKMSMTFLHQNLFFWILAGLLAGRLFYGFENIRLFSGQWERLFFLWDLRLSLPGFLAGMLGALFAHCLRYKEDFWSWFDALTLAGMIMIFFVSLGHFMEGSQYGLPTGLPWGITFSNISIPFEIPIHPTQLYAALGTFLIFGTLMRIQRRHHKSGVVGTAGVLCMSLLWGGVDFLHGLPSLFLKISMGAIALFSFTGLILRTHTPSALQKSLHS